MVNCPSFHYNTVDSSIYYWTTIRLLFWNNLKVFSILLNRKTISMHPLQSRSSGVKGVSKFPREPCFSCGCMLSGAHAEIKIRPFVKRVTAYTTVLWINAVSTFRIYQISSDKNLIFSMVMYVFPRISDSLSPKIWQKFITKSLTEIHHRKSAELVPIW